MQHCCTIPVQAVSQAPGFRMNEVVLPLFQGRISGPAMGGFLPSGPLGSQRAKKTVEQLPQVGACERYVGLTYMLSYLSVWGGVPWPCSIMPVFRAGPTVSPRSSPPSFLLLPLCPQVFLQGCLSHLLHLFVSRLPKLITGVHKQWQTQCLITAAPQHGGAHSAHIP